MTAYFAPLPAVPVFPISTVDTLSSMHSGLPCSLYSVCHWYTSCCHDQTDHNDRMSVCHDRYFAMSKPLAFEATQGIWNKGLNRYIKVTCLDSTRKGWNVKSDDKGIRR